MRVMWGVFAATGAAAGGPDWASSVDPVSAAAIRPAAGVFIWLSSKIVSMMVSETDPERVDGDRGRSGRPAGQVSGRRHPARIEEPGGLGAGTRQGLPQWPRGVARRRRARDARGGLGAAVDRSPRQRQGAPTD